MAKMCRACLAVSKQLKHIFNEDEGHIVIMIKECISIEVTANDGLPYNLCLECHRKLDIAFNFRQFFKYNDRVLRDSLNDKDDPYEKVYLPCDNDDLADVPRINSKDKSESQQVLANIKYKSAHNLNSYTSPKALNLLNKNSNESEDVKFEPEMEITRCLPCDITFSSQDLFLKHQHEVHLIELNDISSLKTKIQIRYDNEWGEMEQIDDVESNSTNKEYDCDQCDMILSTKRMLDKHMKKHIGRKKSCRSDLNTRYIEDGYEYSTKKITKSFRYLRCVKHRPPTYCTAKAKIDNGKFIPVNPTHNHERPRYAEDVLHFRAAIHDMAATSTSKPKEIYDLMAVLYPIGAAQTPYVNIRGSISRWQREGASSAKAN